jgi:hypothetical protein
LYHATRGRKSNRKLAAEVKQKVIEILSQEVYHGFGPTLAAEYLAQKHKLPVSRETARTWMNRSHALACQTEAGREGTSLANAAQPLGRTSAVGHYRTCLAGGPWPEAVSDQHDRRCDQPVMRARFMEHDSTEENMRLLKSYVEEHGRPLSFYTDKAALFVI